MKILLEPNDIKLIKKMLKIADFIPIKKYSIILESSTVGIITVYDATPTEMKELIKRGAWHNTIHGGSTLNKFQVSKFDE